MKKRLFFLLTLCLAVLLFAVSCGTEDVTTENTTPLDSDTDSTPESTNETSETTTEAVATSTEPEKKEPVMKAIDLSFTEQNLCSSAFDPKSNYTEGGFSVYDRWYSTDYMDISDCYGFRYELAGHKYLISMAFYDENMTYLEGIGTTGTSSAAGISGFAVRPEGAKYLRCVTFIGIASYTSFGSPEVIGYETKEDYELALEPYPYHGLTIACIGDSLTEGDYGSFHGGAAIDYRNYPYYLAKSLGCSVINYGKCGYTAQNIYDSYRQGNIDITEADVIVIMLGTNAGLKRNGATQYIAYRNLVKQISNSMKENAQIILVTPPYVSESRPNIAHHVLNVKDATPAVFELAEELSLPVIDANKNSPIQKDKEMIYMPNDGLHMTAKGYEVFAAFMKEEILKILASK